MPEFATFFVLCLLSFLPRPSHGRTGPPSTIPVCCPNHNLTYAEEWDYYQVRPNANLFYWLYYDENADNRKPWLIWLQGGPGASGTGYGNFQEVGPLDVNLNTRKETWLSRGDLLFVDSPVGSGYSYVTDDQAYTTDVDQIAQDLINFIIYFVNTHQQYKDRPFYITSESYGGKVSAVFALGLYRAIQAGNVSMNFRGVGLGDSWISPMDFVDTWPDYLYYFSRLSQSELKQAKASAEQCDKLVKNSQWKEATDCWGQMQQTIGMLSVGVSWYNVLKQSGQDPWSLRFKKGKGRRHRMNPMLYRDLTDDLDALMNGPIREKLGIIPDSIQWGQWSGKVFAKQAEDFMKPVVDTVDALLNSTNLTVFIYNGQLDLICDTAGVERWVEKLKWPGLNEFQKTNRKAIRDEYSNLGIVSFLKKYKHLYFFYILKAGHMVPADAPMGGLAMLDIVTGV